MKKFIKIVAVVLIAVFALLFTAGCKKKIVSGETYYMYTYDSRTDRFVKTGTSLKFGKDFKTFEYSFVNKYLSVMGTVEHSKVPNAYTISCNKEASDVVVERYREALASSGASQEVVALYEAMADTFTPQAQYFVYEDKMFLGSAVEMYHEPDSARESVEGLYRIDDSEEKLRLRSGVMYGADDKGGYTVKQGYYSYSRGILTVTFTNADGSDRYENGVLYRKRYFVAKITLPKGGTLLGTTLEEHLESSAFISKINTQISEYSGKTITVLVDTFFARSL